MNMTQIDIEMHKYATANLFANLAANISALALVFFLCLLFAPNSLAPAVFGVLVSGFIYAWSFQRIKELDTDD